MARLIVCDASVLIGWLDSADSHHAHAREILDEFARDDLGASTLTIAEVLVGAYRQGREKQAGSAITEVGVVEIGLDGRASELAQLRAEAGLPMPDCCVLLAAQAKSAAAVLSFDEKLAKAARALGIPAVPE